MVRTRLPSIVVIAVALMSLFALSHGDPAATAEPPKAIVDASDGMNALTAAPLVEYATVEREVIARDRQLLNRFGGSSHRSRRIIALQQSA